MITAPVLQPTDRVGRLLTRPPVYVDHDAPLLAVAEVMADESIGVVLVRGPRAPLGIISERDLAIAMAEAGDATALPAQDFMTPELASIPATATILDAARLMIVNEIRHLTVVAGGATVGVISIRDVLQVFAQSAGSEVRKDQSPSKV